MIRALIPLIVTGLLVAGCSGLETVPARNKAAHLAAGAGWEYRFSPSEPFALATALSPTRGPVLTAYLEGDGMAYRGVSTVSADPTPANPLALQLALAQPGGGAIAYLARPCQYSQFQGLGRNCQPAYWTSHRYAPEVISSVSSTLDDLKQRSGANRLILVGYSGGGVVAALLAARRNDIDGLITVASNLDVGYWTTRDRLAPLHGSLDPVNAASTLKTVPQVHFIGSADQVVPPDVVPSYLAKLGTGATAVSIGMQGFDHTCCWQEHWPGLYRRALTSLPRRP